MSLRQIQQAFRAAIYDGQTETLAELSAGPQQLSAQLGIDVYRNNTRERLKQVLAQTYPVCEQLVGEPCFARIASAHVDAYPCRTSDLERYGEELFLTIAGVLQEQAWLDQVPYLADMARLEWAVHQAYMACNRPVFDFHAFGQLEEHDHLKVRFHLAPDITALAVNWPVAAIWQMHQPGQKIAALDIDSQAQWLLVERPEYRTQVQPIDETSYHLLTLIAKPLTLGELLDERPETENGLAALLSKGWITGFARMG